MGGQNVGGSMGWEESGPYRRKSSPKRGRLQRSSKSTKKKNNGDGGENPDMGGPMTFVFGL